MSMTREEVDAYLSRAFPTPLGVVATVGENGPQVVPVWFRWHGERVTIWTGDHRRWVRNIAHDPRVAFSVHSDEPWMAAVVLRGRASVETSDAPEVDVEIEAITRRYREPSEVPGFIAEWNHLRSIVTIVPSRINSWGTPTPDLPE